MGEKEKRKKKRKKERVRERTLKFQCRNMIMYFNWVSFGIDYQKIQKKEKDKKKRKKKRKKEKKKKKKKPEEHKEQETQYEEQHVQDHLLLLQQYKNDPFSLLILLGAQRYSLLINFVAFSVCKEKKLILIIFLLSEQRDKSKKVRP